MPKKNAPNVRIGLRLLCEIELSLQSCAHFAGLIFQKCSKHVIFLRFLCETELSTVSCTFCQPHLPKVFRTCQFVFRFFCETELSLQSRAHFANLIFQKCSEHVNLFSDFFVKPSSRYSLVHISPTSSSKSAPNVTAFQHIQAQIALSLQPCARSVDRGPQPRKQRPYFGERPLYPKKTQGFAPEPFQA